MPRRSQSSTPVKSSESALIRTKDGCNFTVNKNHLADSNKYFRALFFGGFNDGTDIFIQGVTGNTMRSIINFLDTGKCDLDDTNIENMLFATDYLMVDVLGTMCQDYALRKMNPKNCINFFTIAWKIGNPEFFNACKRYLQTHFEEAIQKTNKNIVRELPVDVLKNILNDKNLNVSSEDIVWNVIVQWVTTKSRFNRFAEVPNLLGLLSRMEIRASLAKEIMSHPIVECNPFCKALCTERVPRGRKFSPFPALRFMHRVLNFQSQLSGLRIPRSVHFIAYNNEQEQRALFVYLTYDDQLDIWRMIGKFKFRPDSIVRTGHIVYLFDTWNNGSLAFDLSSELWFPVQPLTLSRSGYCVVALGEYIYIMGGVENNLEAMDTIQRYHPKSGARDTIRPMLPMVLCEAFVFRGRIYAIGDVKIDKKPTMMVQVYNPDWDSWSTISAPEKVRHDFASVVYHGRIYLVGGADSDVALKTVEEYDPGPERWRPLPDLPVAFIQPKAVVLKDRMLVYESLPNRNGKIVVPPVLWNPQDEEWVVLDPSSPLYYVSHYIFHTLTGKRVLKQVTKNNRSRGVVWEKCLLG